MLERRLQVFQCRGVISTDWLASLLQLFKQFGVNIRKIELLSCLAQDGSLFSDELELRIEFEEKTASEPLESLSLLRIALNEHLKLLERECSLD